MSFTSDPSQLPPTVPPASGPITADTNENRDAILRACSFHRGDFERMLIWLDASGKHDVVASLRSPFKTVPQAGLVLLDSLPPELVFMVLANLGLASFFAFRRVNRRARALATALPKYALLATHALQPLVALLRTRLAPNFTIDSIYDRLDGPPECSECGDMGKYLFMPTLSRCCLPCLENSAAFAVLPISALAKLAGQPLTKTRRLLEKITVHTLPGRYTTPGGGSPQVPKTLVTHHQARARLHASGICTYDLLPKRCSRPASPHQRYMASVALPWFSLTRRELEHGVSCAGCFLQMGVDPLFVNLNSQNQVYTHAQFLHHFEGCSASQKMWSNSGRGTKSCTELSMFDRWDALPTLDAE